MPRQALNRAREEQQASLLALQSDAEDEVERLRSIESQRLQDEAVVAALLAQQREEARQAAEFERRQAEANRVRQESDIARAAGDLRWRALAPMPWGVFFAAVRPQSLFGIGSIIRIPDSVFLLQKAISQPKFLRTNK